MPNSSRCTAVRAQWNTAFCIRSLHARRFSTMHELSQSSSVLIIWSIRRPVYLSASANCLRLSLSCSNGSFKPVQIAFSVPAATGPIRNLDTNPRIESETINRFNACRKRSASQHPGVASGLHRAVVPIPVTPRPNYRSLAIPINVHYAIGFQSRLLTPQPLPRIIAKTLGRGRQIVTHMNEIHQKTAIGAKTLLHLTDNPYSTTYSNQISTRILTKLNTDSDQNEQRLQQKRYTRSTGDEPGHAA